jgi:hypothetical protein
VSPVKYEPGFYIPEDDILHSDCREHLRSRDVIHRFPTPKSIRSQLIPIIDPSTTATPFPSPRAERWGHVSLTCSLCQVAYSPLGVRTRELEAYGSVFSTGEVWRRPA